MTRTREEWEARYVAGDLPWDTGTVDPELERCFAEARIAPCRALEVGCGTGTNAIWLAERGFEVVATDLSATAIARARAKAQAAGVSIAFHEGSFPEERGFGLIYDRGCFHTLDEAEDRLAFAAEAAARLAASGLWLSLIGSTDGPPRDSGPPRRSARDIAGAVEPSFEILRLEAVSFEAKLEGVPRAWLLLARKR